MRIWCCSYEAGILEDPDVTPPRDMWQLTVDPMDAPDKPEDFQITFEKGVPVKLEWKDDGKGKMVEDPLELFLAANKIGGRNGVGRVDIVENRFIGLKSRVSKTSEHVSTRSEVLNKLETCFSSAKGIDLKEEC